MHLWDALSGQLRATYAAHNAADEVHAATSLAFSQVSVSCSTMMWSLVTSGPPRGARTAGPNAKVVWGNQCSLVCCCS